jgi:phosphoribosylformylglycinamidine synthase subunit PurS
VDGLRAPPIAGGGARLRRAGADDDRGRPVRATVLVRPKEGILDPQGEAVRTALDHLGFPASAARVGRVIDLEFEGRPEQEARRELERMCEELLANPLIESYEIEVRP